jgi:fibronectin type III domain protein
VSERANTSKVLVALAVLTFALVASAKPAHAGTHGIVHAVRATTKSASGAAPASIRPITLASPTYGDVDGQFVEGAWSCILGEITINGDVASYAGYYAEVSGGSPDGNYPKVGDLDYEHLVVSLIGNPCTGYDADGVQLSLPAGTELAVSQTNPVHCIAHVYSGGVWSTYDWTNDPNFGCPHNPQMGSGNGGYDIFLWTGQIPGNTWVDFRFPVYYTQPLDGLSSSSKIDGWTSSGWVGTQTYTAPVYAPDAVPAISYPTPATTNVTGSSATVTGYTTNHARSGEAYVDWGTTTAYSHSIDDGPIDGTQPYPSWQTQRNLTGLATGTTYHWRLRFVTSGGTYSGADRTFTTTGAPNTAITSGPGTYLRSTTATFKFSSSATGATFTCKLDGATTGCSSPKSYNGLAQGSHTFSVASTVGGMTDPTPAVRTFKLDTVAPSAPGIPSSALTVGSIAPTAAAGALPVRISWTAATDTTSGIAKYQLWQSVSGGAFTLAATLTSPATVRNLTPGTQYRFDVRAIDGAGNVGAYAVGTAFKVTGTQENAASYTGTWTAVTNTSYWGGATRQASAAGATAKLVVSAGARSIAVVARKGTDRGRINVYVDGALKTPTPIDLYASALAPRLYVGVFPLSTSVGHTVSVTLTGTKNAASTGTYANIDGFVTLR